MTNGATVTNSWACRSCLQFNVNFVLDSTQLATVINSANTYVELWFSTDVVAGTHTFPVVSTAAASAPNGIQMHFDSSHQWPQNRIQFDGQLRHDLSSGEMPTVIGVRVCATDPTLTSTATTASTAATTVSTQAGDTTAATG